MRVVLDLDDAYAQALYIVAVGAESGQMNSACRGWNLSEGAHLSVKRIGDDFTQLKTEQSKDAADGVIHCSKCANWIPNAPEYDEDLHRYFPADEGTCCVGHDAITNKDFYCGWAEEGEAE